LSHHSKITETYVDPVDIDVENQHYGESTAGAAGSVETERPPLPGPCSSAA